VNLGGIYSGWKYRIWNSYVYGIIKEKIRKDNNLKIFKINQNPNKK
jgi:hypothetical protein